MEGVGRSFEGSRVCFSRGRTAASEEGAKGYIYPSPKNSCYSAGYVVLGASDNMVELPMHSKQIAQAPFDGGRKELPGGVSELPTRATEFFT